MFPLPASAYLYIALALGTVFVTHRIDGYYSEKAQLSAVQHVLETQTKIIQDQATVSQQTQKDKDDLQTSYNNAIAELRGLRTSTPTANQPTSPVIPSQGLRLLESDAEDLIGFARQCEISEIERNDVIQKYNSLLIK